MAPTIKLISLNIEGDRHLNCCIPFIKNEHADIVCLQEVFEKDVEFIKKELQMHGEYEPLQIVKNQSGENPWGLLTLTRMETRQVKSAFYVKNTSDHTLPIHDVSNIKANRKILITEVIKDAKPFKIINTHFTWSPKGEPTELQYEHLNTMLKLLDAQKEFVICGDFNAPRGRAIWELLSARYTDNIPEHIKTTIDQTLHKVPGLQYVVDGMFSTHEYKVTDVTIKDGVSDHMAVVSTIGRKRNYSIAWKHFRV